MPPRDLKIEGLPGFIPDEISDRFRNRVSQAVNDLLYQSGLKNLEVTVGAGTSSGKKAGSSQKPQVAFDSGNNRREGEELSVEERARQYTSREPFFGFEFLVVPDEVRETLLSAVEITAVEETVFEQWNLKSIEPFPRTALNLHGPPGTGKTLAAHALAHYLGKPILLASYAQVESKYVGDGSKNIEAIFHAAERDDALLFVDEADSLLSRRLTDVTQGAEQAINSMRSQLLICLEKYRGIVVFSTNLVENYDRAFDTRMRHIYFPMPDQAARQLIWEKHLPSQLPLADDVNAASLAVMDDICGRDIKNAVIDAALRAARSKNGVISQVDLEKAVERIKTARLGRSYPVNR